MLGIIVPRILQPARNPVRNPRYACVKKETVFPKILCLKMISGLRLS